MPSAGPDSNPAVAAYLGRCVHRFRALCRLRRAEGDEDTAAAADARAALDAASDLGTVPAPLAELGQRFELSPLESEVVELTLCAFLDPAFKSDLALVHGPIKRLHVYVERVVALLGSDIATRVEARRALAAEARLATSGILRLKDTTYSKDPSLFELKLSPSAINAIMGQPLSESSTRGIALLEAPRVPLDSVVLPEWKDEVVRLVSGFRAYRQRLDDWGVGEAIHYGKGLVILFSGPPGTGKTMLAHALAAHVQRPLMTIHTGRLIENSQSTETLFEDLFFEAQFHGAIPFFDECELLFERRTLHFYDHLHALERYDGVIVLATNEDMRLDEALERRVTYHARFRLPDIPHREAIWRYHLPESLPVEDDLNLQGLAEQFELSGGQIKNAVLLAVNKSLAGQGENAVLREEHLVHASAAQLRARLDDLATSCAQT